MHKAIVTGANGHIGANLCRALLRRDVDVVAFVRHGSDRRGIDGLEVQLAEGDILDPDSLHAAARGCDVMFHCASAFAIWARRDDDILRPAIEGTENALRAAAAAEIDRVVLTSSVATVGAIDSPDLPPRDADAWADDLTVPYYLAKQRAERRAWELAEELGLALVSVLPTLVLGPHDHRVTPSSRLVLDMLRGTGATLDGGGNVIDARDVAEGHVLAAERGRPGARYILGGENLTTVELGRLVTELTGAPVKHVGLPRWMLSMVASSMELGAAISGSPPPMTRAVVRDLVGRYAWFDVSRTRDELGLCPRSPEAVVRDTARWFLDQGAIEGDAAERVRRGLARSVGAPARVVA